MDFFCEVGNRSFIENQSEYNNYLAILRNKIYKILYNKYTSNNFSLDEVTKTLNDYISIHNKNFDFYFINSEFVIEFDDKFIAKIETNCFYNRDIININRYLLYYIDCFISRGYKFYNINQMTINSISDRCNMTYEHYLNQAMHMCERKLNMKIAKNPQLIISLYRNKKHPSIRKYSHIPFNN